MLAGVLERCMKRRGVRDCDPYDWEKLAEAPQSLTTSSSSTAVPSKPAQRMVTNPGTANATTDNNLAGDDPLVVSLGLNNQENVHPSEVAATAAAASAAAAAVDKRTPLQAAQVTGSAAEREGTTEAVNGQNAGQAGQDKSPKKRRLEGGGGGGGGGGGADALVPPPLSQTDRQSRRAAAILADAATPDSLADTENSREVATGGGGHGGHAELETGFTPLAVSASMPAVLVAGRAGRPFAPSLSVPQPPGTPADSTAAAGGGGQTSTSSALLRAVTSSAGGGGLASPSGGAEKGARGRTNLRRFHSMHAHNHSPGSSRVGVGRAAAVRDAKEMSKDRDRERDRDRDRDTSYTQCALADDDNVSALQQVTRAGGGKKKKKKSKNLKKDFCLKNYFFSSLFYLSLFILFIHFIHSIFILFIPYSSYSFDIHCIHSFFILFIHYSYFHSLFNSKNFK